LIYSVFVYLGNDSRRNLCFQESSELPELNGEGYSMGIRTHDAARISIEPEIFPLVVDLDGTLTKTDLLHENFFESLTQGLKRHVSACIVVRQGKAQLKAALAEASSIDYELLPYNESVLTLIQEARAQGRRVYLATASDQRHAEGVAAHIGLFDGIFA